MCTLRKEQIQRWVSFIDYCIMPTRWRQAKDASIILSRGNYRNGPPLSQVNGIQIKNKGKGSNDNGQVKGNHRNAENKENNKQRVRQEPGTDDEPLSSSEEEEEEKKEEEKISQEEEEEADSTGERTKAGANKRKRNGGSDGRENTKSQKSNPPSSAPTDESVHSLFNSTKRTMYGRSKSQSYGSSQEGFKHPRAIKESNLKSADSFLVPRDVNVPGTPQRRKTQGSSTNIHTSVPQPAFRMPAAPALDSPVAQFREPAIPASSSAFTTADPEFDLDDDDDDTSSLSSLPSEISLAMAELADDQLATLQVNPTDTNTAEESRCPNCNAPVDADLLHEFLVLKGRRLRDERLFCERHKAYKAENEWSDKGYPTIDWPTFENRIQRHLSQLERLLVPSPTSFFRGRLESAMKDGQAKVFKFSVENENMENLSCGYYGPKGASRMLVFFKSDQTSIFKETAFSS